MKTKQIISATILATMMVACGQKQSTSSDLIHLNYQETEIQEEAPKLSTLLKDIRYVALETNDSCLLNRPTNITLTDKYIVMDGGDKTGMLRIRQEGREVSPYHRYARRPGTYGIYLGNLSAICARKRDSPKGRIWKQI